MELDSVSRKVEEAVNDLNEIFSAKANIEQPRQQATKHRAASAAGDKGEETFIKLCQYLCIKMDSICERIVFGDWFGHLQR